LGFVEDVVVLVVALVVLVELVLPEVLAVEPPLPL